MQARQRLQDATRLLHRLAQLVRHRGRDRDRREVSAQGIQGVGVGFPPRRGFGELSKRFAVHSDGAAEGCPPELHALDVGPLSQGL